MFSLNQCASLLVILLVCCAAAPSSRPATTSTSTRTDRLNDPSFWLEKASAEWKQIGPGTPKPWREMAAAQVALRDLGGLSSTLEEAKTLEPPKTTGYPYVNDRTVHAYRSLVPFFAQAGDDEGMRRAISIATDPSHEAGPDAKSLPLDGNRASIAKELAKIGRDAEALTLANSTRVPRDRVGALIAIAVEAAQAGRTHASNRAFAAASQAAAIAEKAQRGMGFRPLAYGYLDTGNFAKALEIGQSLEDESRASFLSRAAVKYSKAGRTQEAAKYAKLATAIIVEGNWKRFSWGAREVADRVAETGDRPSIAQLVKLAKEAVSAPPGPQNDLGLSPPPKGRNALASESFASHLYVGLAVGSARRGDVAAAKQYLRSDEQLWRSIADVPLAVPWYRDVLVQVAHGLMAGGKLEDAVTLIDTIPSKVPPGEARPGVDQFALNSLRNNCVQFYENAGDLKRAAELYQESSGTSPPPFAWARVRMGQLAQLMAEIEHLPAPEARCTWLAVTATELASARVPIQADPGPARP